MTGAAAARRKWPRTRGATRSSPGTSSAHACVRQSDVARAAVCAAVSSLAAPSTSRSLSNGDDLGLLCPATEVHALRTAFDQRVLPRLRALLGEVQRGGAVSWDSVLPPANGESARGWRHAVDRSEARTRFKAGRTARRRCAKPRAAQAARARRGRAGWKARALRGRCW